MSYVNKRGGGSMNGDMHPGPVRTAAERHDGAPGKQKKRDLSQREIDRLWAKMKRAAHP